MSKFSDVVKEKREMVSEFLLSRGYTKDRWGNFCKFRKDGTKVRYRFLPRVIRHEVLCHHDNSPAEWLHLHSAQYQKVGINSDNKLIGFERAWFF